MYIPRLSLLKNSPVHLSLRYVVGFFVVLLVLVLLVISFLSTLPRQSEEKIVIIPEGTSLIGTADILKEEDLIRSPLLFRVTGQLQKISVKAGTYSFVDERRMTEILRRLNSADYGDVYTSVTFPEGISVIEMGEILDKENFQNFNRAEFEVTTKDKEGYLFPDTYQFLPEVTTESVVGALSETFEKRTEEFKKLKTEFSWEDIIIMASIIEKEANQDFQEQQTVAGILWKRINQGIPLQVDAPFVYAIGKGSSELRTKDLRADGLYNTYTRKGLPPTPIGNPGLSAIEAAMNPIESLYFFYLHDTNGGIHYGVTHDDHVRNKQRYL